MNVLLHIGRESVSEPVHESTLYGIGEVTHIDGGLYKVWFELVAAHFEVSSVKNLKKNMKMKTYDS
jgi:hypothetical protein